MAGDMSISKKQQKNQKQEEKNEQQWRNIASALGSICKQNIKNKKAV